MNQSVLHDSRNYPDLIDY